MGLPGSAICGCKQPQQSYHNRGSRERISSAQTPRDAPVVLSRNMYYVFINSCGLDRGTRGKPMLHKVTLGEHILTVFASQSALNKS